MEEAHTPAMGRADVSLLRRIGGLIQACHPFPTVMVVTLTFLLGIVSSGADLDATSLALAGVAMLLSQLSIGWSNDYLDRDRDAMYQRNKPIAAGLVSAMAVGGLAGLALAVSLVAAALLGLTTLSLFVLGTACGFAYNVFLKDTRWSWAPYVLAFAVLPLFVWSALDSFRDEYLGLYAIGAPLVVAAHIANTLPDIEADNAAGAGGLVVSLGRSRALGLLFACLLLPLGTIAVSLLWLDYDAVALGITLGSYSALVIAATLAYRASPFARAAALGFRFVALGAVVLAAGWLASV